MTEADLYAPILTEFSRGNTRLWRFNAGLAWAGEIVSRSATHITLRNPRPIKLGPPGMSDLIGFRSIEAEGHDLAIFTALELKSPTGRVTAEQAAFIDLVKWHGGRAGVARSVEDAGLIISGVL